VVLVVAVLVDMAHMALHTEHWDPGVIPVLSIQAAEAEAVQTCTTSTAMQQKDSAPVAS
jgi:hypothetical protein